MEEEKRSELMMKEIHKEYKKAPDTVEDDINTEARKFAVDLEIDDRVFRMEKRSALITIKDHKAGFMDNPKVRLINPSKSELGRAAKKILGRINKELKEVSGLTQWESDLKCIDWFTALENKAQLKFLKADIDSFYPSISEELLDNALTWASSLVDISEEEKELFVHTKKSLLWDGKTTWVKKGASLFDVTMGSFDGAETCDVVGLFLLSELSKLPIQVGLYRDDVLSVSQLSEQQVERVSQQMRDIFRQHGLGLKVEANMRVTDFLDVLFDLKEGTHRAWVKPEQVIHYVHQESNHPAHVLKNIPAEVERRLSLLSSSKEMFEAAKGPFQDALKRAGYNKQLEYNQNKVRRTGKRTRNRRVLWFNPPFCLSVKTNLGRQFLQLLDRSFPPGNPLRKILNRHTVQLSYRTLPNLGKIVAGHNAKISNPTTINLEEENCNCRGKDVTCLMEGSRCKDSDVVYQAEVSAVGKPVMKYVGVAATSWKLRYGNHKNSFKYANKRKTTRLAGYVWSLKDEGLEPEIKWRILSRNQSFKASSNCCRLCLKEKFILMHKPEEATINSRDEFFSGCLHKHTLLL